MMNILKYPYALPALPYAYDALEPYIDTETMHYHHDKHFKTYIDNLNKLLQPYPHLQAMSLTQLLENNGAIPKEAFTAIMNNAGGVYNHNLFFQKLAPADSNMNMPSDMLMKEIVSVFGSYDEFMKQFTENAMSVFGSGWTALGLDKDKKLKIFNLKNQDTTIAAGASEPIILFDVWEHAYYLKYRNARVDYVNNLWQIVKFPQM